MTSVTFKPFIGRSPLKFREIGSKLLLSVRCFLFQQGLTVLGRGFFALWSLKPEASPAQLLLMSTGTILFPPESKHLWLSVTFSGLFYLLQRPFSYSCQSVPGICPFFICVVANKIQFSFLFLGGFLFEGIIWNYYFISACLLQTNGPYWL